MTLVSVVGDFYSSVLPLFYEFSTKIKNHVIIYDDFNVDVLKAKKIIKGTKAFIQEKELPIMTYTLQIDEDSLKSIEKIESYINSLEDDKSHIYINATDGLANISLLLSAKMLPLGVNFLTYDRFDNSYNLLTKESMQTFSLKSCASIEEHFLLKNITIEARAQKSLADRYEENLHKIFGRYDGDVQEYMMQEGVSDDYLATTPVGFLYEFYIYNLLKRLNHDDIEIGLRLNDIYSSSSAMQNEFDILIMKNNHLHMIECKFRTNLAMVELVYKMDSVRSVLDDESKVMILTKESIYDKQSDVVKFHLTPLYKRANAKKIYMRGSPVGDIKRFIYEVDEIFGLESENIEQLLPQAAKEQQSKRLESVDAFHKEISEFLKSQFDADIDIFNKREIGKILNYKVNYRKNKKLTESMQNPHIKELMLQLNRVKNFRDIVELQTIFVYFHNNFAEVS